MYLHTKKILMIFFIAAAFSSCSSDDSSSDDGNNLEGVPTGEIVALSLRNATLTGFSQLSRNEGTQKWWTHIISDFNYSGCGEEDGFSQEGNGYYAFYPDGTMHEKSGIDGNPTFLQIWQWTDASQSAIYVRGDTNVPFTVTYLNDDNVVYGSNQSISGSCSIISYEQLGDPHFED